MRLLSQVLGHPEKEYPSIHVAGTNGKGSVCAMLESVYRKAGYKTGLFTSPHLVYLGERIRINGKTISKDKITHYVNYLRQVASNYAEPETDDYPSFFEFLNAMAFLFFKEEQVDIAIIETGLGGELDSTNIISPLASVITTIGKDHEHILGNTLAQIAKAKAGIIKKNTPVIMGNLPQAAEAVVFDVAKSKNARIYSLKEFFKNNSYPKTNLAGHYQRTNAAIALLTTNILNKELPISPKALEEGLLSVSWPGRWDERILPSGTSLILDATHNQDGIPVLVENVKTHIKKHKAKPTIIFSSMRKDRAAQILPHIANLSYKIILVGLKQHHAVTVDELLEAVPKEFKHKTQIENIDCIFDLNTSPVLKETLHPVLVVGSIYLLGEAFQSLFSEELFQSY